MGRHSVNNQQRRLPVGSQQSGQRRLSAGSQPQRLPGGSQGLGQDRLPVGSQESAPRPMVGEAQRMSERVAGASGSSGRGRHSASASSSRGRHGKARKRIFASTLTACCLVLAIGVVGFLAMSEPVGMLQTEGGTQNVVMTPASQEVTINDDATPMAGPEARELSDDELQQVADELLALVNEKRNDSGRNDLSDSGALQATASVRASELPDAWSHTRPNGDDWSESLQEEGFAVGDIYAAENVAMASIDSSFGYQDQDFAQLAATLYETMASHSDQQKNLLSRYYRYVGMGFSQVESDDRITVYLCLHCCSERE